MKPSIEKIGIFPNGEKQTAQRLAEEIAAWLVQRGYKPHLSQTVVNLEGDLDLGLVLGGDGTMIKAIKELSPRGVPILGINLGNFGFLAELEAKEVFAELPLFLEGKGVADERLLLAVETGEGRFLAANEAVVAKRGVSRLIGLEVKVDGGVFATYRADGVVLATPTGSSAYSFSCGGPLLGPEVGAMLLTPICPHSLFSRSLVLEGNATVGMKLVEGDGGVLCIDGQLEVALNRGEEILLHRAAEVATFLRRPGWNFYREARRKMERPRREGE